MFVQPIETTSNQPIVDWRDFAPCAAPLFACAPEVVGQASTMSATKKSTVKEKTPNSSTRLSLERCAPQKS